jgi:hypothetical protein
VNFSKIAGYIRGIAKTQNSVCLLGESVHLPDWGLDQTDSMSFINIFLGEKAPIGLDQLIVHPINKETLIEEANNRLKQGNKSFGVVQFPNHQPYIFDYSPLFLKEMA